MHSRLKIAIIGIGRWGKNLVRDMSEVSEVKYAVSSGEKANLDWLKTNYPKIIHTTNLQEVLADKEISAVVVATPIHTHFEIAKKALLADKNVFVEKPITEKIEDASELVRIAKEKNKILFVGHTFIYHEVLEKIASELKGGSKIHLEFVWNKFGSFTEDIRLNLLCHEISIFYYLFGRPDKAKIIEERAVKSACDIHISSYEWENGNKALISIDRSSLEKEKKITIITPTKTFLWKNNDLYLFDKEKNDWILSYSQKKETLKRECSSFIDCITKNKKPETSGEFGLKILEIIYSLPKAD